jgi:hypothetical protein
MRTGQKVRVRGGAPAFSGARYDAPGNQTTANGADTQIAFNAPASYDTDDYTATADQFTVPDGLDGLFQLTAYVNLSAMAWDRTYIVYFDGFYTSTMGDGFIGGVKIPTTDGVTNLITLSPPPYPLSAGDHVQLYVRQDAGATETILMASFSITRLGDIPA